MIGKPVVSSVLAVFVLLLLAGCGSTREKPFNSPLDATGKKGLSPIAAPTREWRFTPTPTSVAIPIAPRLADFSMIEMKPLLSDPDVFIFSDSWSPDSQSFLYGKVGDGITSGRAELWHYSLVTGKRTKLTNNGSAPSWSPDGHEVRYFAYKVGSKVEGRLMNITSGKVTTTVESEIQWLQYLRNGDIAFVEGEQIKVRERDGSVLVWPNVIFEDPLAEKAYVAPDGSALAFSRRDTLTLVSRSGEQVKIGETYGLARVTWSPDSQRLAYATERNPDSAKLRLYVVASGTNIPLILSSAFNEEVMFPSWSPDGKTIAIGRYVWRGDKPTAMWLVSIDGTALQKLADGVIFAYWAPDGKRLLYREDTPSGDIGIITVGR